MKNYFYWWVLFCGLFLFTIPQISAAEVYDTPTDITWGDNSVGYYNFMQFTPGVDSVPLHVTNYGNCPTIDIRNMSGLSDGSVEPPPLVSCTVGGGNCSFGDVGNFKLVAGQNYSIGPSANASCNVGYYGSALSLPIVGIGYNWTQSGYASGVVDFTGDGTGRGGIVNFWIESLGGGPILPIITPVYPVNTSVYSSYNGSLIFTTNTPANASVNDSRYALNTTGGTLHQFTSNPNDFSEGIITLFLQANNSGVPGNATLTFTIDTTNPTITSNLQNNNTNWTISYTQAVNVTDTSNLASVSINDSCGNTYTNVSPITPFVRSTNYDISACGIGTKYTNVTTCDVGGNCGSASYQWNAFGFLNVSGYDTNNNVIGSFMISTNATPDYSTTTGSVLIPYLSIKDYNITIDAFGYELKSAVVSITGVSNYYNFSLFTQNSVNISIYDESTGISITNLVDITFTSDTTSFSNSTSTGKFFIDELPPNYYQLLFESAGYDSRTYVITIDNRSHQNLNVYLANSSVSETTLFTVKDVDSFEVLGNVQTTMYRFLNGSWQTVESKYTDITGKAQFNYLNDVNYKFYMNKAGYIDYVFYLNPILFSSYDIQMSRETLVNFSSNYEGIGVIYAPTIFPANTNTSFSWLISNPEGSLISYGINITYPGGNVVATGTNAIGGQLSAVILPTGATVFDVVRLDYYYDTTLSGRRNFTYFYPITFNNAASNYTFLSNQNKTYGLGVFERSIIFTFIMILIVGISAIAGKLIPGFTVALLFSGYFAYIGFMPLWLILPSMLIGVLFLMWKGGGA